MTTKHAASYDGLASASTRASRAASASSRKRDTAPELALRRELWARGYRYRVDVRTLPGRPDIVFPGPRIAVFCDGDFWHGRNLEERLARLAAGHNAEYWVTKIRSNVERDRRVCQELEAAGWLVMRFWESSLKQDVRAAADAIAIMIKAAHGAQGRPLRRAGR